MSANVPISYSEFDFIPHWEKKDKKYMAGFVYKLLCKYSNKDGLLSTITYIIFLEYKRNPKLMPSPSLCGKIRTNLKRQADTLNRESESISKNALHLISADSGADIDLRLDVLIEELIAQDREDLVAIINKKLSGKRIVGTDYRRLRAARKLIEDICLS
jgi:hypothetical protein